jgi:NTP pyrophosphatase (non-canonical NTP hydrolase)
MNLKYIQERVDEQIQRYGGYWNPLSMMLRLIEEVGELSRALNIKYGEKKSKGQTDGREVEYELVDVLYTIIAIANASNLKLRDKLVLSSKEAIKRNNNLTVLSNLIIIIGDTYKKTINNISIEENIYKMLEEVKYIISYLDIDIKKYFEEKLELDEWKVNEIYN